MPNLKKEDAEAIYVSGKHMSNWMYNVSQNPDFSKYAQSMQEMVREWDAVGSLLVRKRVTSEKE